MEEIEWRDVDGFEELYEVCADGIVRDKRRRRALSVSVDNRVCLYVDGRRFQRTVARIVAEAFKPYDGMDADKVLHVDGNKGNNAVSNLRWMKHEAQDVSGIKMASQKPGRPTNESRLRDLEASLSVAHKKLDDIIDLIKSGAVASCGVPDEAYDHLRADVDAVKEIVSKLPPTAADTIRNAEMMMEENGFYD